VTATSNTKTYDGTTSAAGLPTITSGSLAPGDTPNFVETYNTRNVGTGLTLTPSGTVNDGNGGNNYTVTTAANHTGVILSAIGTHLVIHTQPSATATAGQVFPTQPVVYVEDQSGDLVTSDNTTQVTVTLRVGNGPLLGTTTVTVSGGIGTFTNLQDNKAGTIILLFTAPTLTKAQSNSIVVNPAAASRLSIAAPASTTAGLPFSITVTAYDAYNNIATGYQGTVHFTSSDGLATLPKNYAFTASDEGVHTFGNGMTLRTSGTQTITAFDAAHQSIEGSASVNVAAGPNPGVLAIDGNGVSAHVLVATAVKRQTP